VHSVEQTLKIAPVGLLTPAFVRPREITKFRDWYIGCRVVSAVHGYGTVKAFALTDLSATKSMESQRVEWVEVNFDQVGLKQMPPNTRDLKLISPKPRPFRVDPA
jgi:hypothetical protein